MQTPRGITLLIAVCVLYGCVAGCTSLSSEATGISAGESTAPVGTTATPPIESPQIQLSVTAEQPERSPGVDETPTVMVNAPEYLEQDLPRITSTRTPSLSLVATEPVTTVSTPAPTATSWSSSSDVSTTPIASPEATVTVPATTPAAITVGLSVQAQEFSPSRILVPARARVTVVFNNRDAGVPHNMVVFADPGMTTPIFTGKVIIGRNQVNYTFTAPSQPGEYILACGIPSPHRTGTLVVE